MREASGNKARQAANQKQREVAQLQQHCPEGDGLKQHGDGQNIPAVLPGHDAP